jgi:polyisoprenoid-binding protein YceI
MPTSTLNAAAGTAIWKLDSTHAHVEFAVRHLMISKVRGQFADFDATLRLDETDVSGSALGVEIRTASIDTRVEQRDEHLRSPDFLDAEKYPTLTFESTVVERVDDDRLRVTGALTIRDVTKEVELDVVERGSVTDPWGGERVGFAAKTKIDRKDFGLTWNQALETGGVLVGDEVEIAIEAEFVRATEE